MLFINCTYFRSLHTYWCLVKLVCSVAFAWYVRFVVMECDVLQLLQRKWPCVCACVQWCRINCLLTLYHHRKLAHLHTLPICHRRYKAHIRRNKTKKIKQQFHSYDLWFGNCFCFMCSETQSMASHITWRAFFARFFCRAQTMKSWSETSLYIGGNWSNSLPNGAVIFVVTIVIT